MVHDSGSKGCKPHASTRAYTLGDITYTQSHALYQDYDSECRDKFIREHFVKENEWTLKEFKNHDSCLFIPVDQLGYR